MLIVPGLRSSLTGHRHHSQGFDRSISKELQGGIFVSQQRNTRTLLIEPLSDEGRWITVEENLLFDLIDRQGRDLQMRDILNGVQFSEQRIMMRSRRGEQLIDENTILNGHAENQRVRMQSEARGILRLDDFTVQRRRERMFKKRFERLKTNRSLFAR